MTEKRLTRTAQRLRKDMTEVEKALWSQLRGAQLEGFKFVRQFPLGPYITDFACRNAKLVIELDGGQHAKSTTDDARTRLIEAHGYRVIRFWNNDVYSNINGVLEAIRNELLLARNHVP